MSPESAIASLENGAMKWSIPKLLNDPFEFPASMDFKFTGEEIANALTEELVTMAYGPNEPTSDPNNQFIQLTLLNRRLRNRPPAEKFRAFIAEVNAGTIQRFEENLVQRRAFLAEYRNQFTVFCVSAKKDNLLMWAHYAKNHTGCVFQFRCLPELDRTLSAAIKVNYVETYPVIGSLGQYVKHLTGQAEINYDNLFNIFAFTKSQHWDYEDEWRCISKLNNHETGFDFKPFIPEELEAIYIGHRASQEHKDSILNTLRGKYQETKVFSSSVNIQDYSMLFHENR